MPLTGWGLHHLFENFREYSLMQDLSNNTTGNPPLFSLVTTFKDVGKMKYRRREEERDIEVDI